MAYARALERLTGADMSKLFPTPNIPTAKIPECRVHIERGEHTRLYRWSHEHYHELGAVFNGPHPETGDELHVAEDEISPEGAPWHDLPPQTAVFAPAYAPEEIIEVAQRLRKAAGLPDKPTGEVANESESIVDKVKEKIG